MTIAATLASVTLEDKYRAREGRVYLSGTQALVRLPMIQRQIDLAAGLNTAGFVSGYRGSPLGNYDYALWHAREILQESRVTFAPGLNEELAATAVWGSQQVGLFPGATYDGVFGIWYGKGPGVDRATDALKHGNAAGSSRHGGVICLAGDDHGAHSSTLAHQSEQIFQAAMMPVLNPATVQEYVSFGLYAFALSRFSGCWIGFKAVSETVESSASILLDPEAARFIAPDFEPPPGGLNIRWPDPAVESEKRLHGPKMDAVAAFSRANPVDELVFDAPRARFGILAAGKAYLDTRQALLELGLRDEVLRALGVRIYKVGLTWPLEPQGARRFAEGLKTVLVVEEKRGFVEDQLLRISYHLPSDRRPTIVGKADEQGQPLLPSTGELTPTLVAKAIVERLGRLGAITGEVSQRLSRLESFEQGRVPSEPLAQRSPYFCSGCPHNSSTKVPDGSRAMAGIGCHAMAMWMPNRNTATLTQMGGEGANWLGQAPFTSEAHVFQNLGDGTYTHSGLLAIRAAAVSGVNITYKILYNDAVAMTGGQPLEGHYTVAQISRQVAAEGAQRVVVVTDEPDKYTRADDFAPEVEIRHRDELDAVQRELRAVRGLTVLIYDQTCAAEKRRRRKRGLYPDPDRRVFINERVCEGCGDCSAASNCVSVVPLETELGRKRAIDQSSCNKDFSCLGGFCPSFVTVKGGRPRKHRATDGSGAPGPLPDPPEFELRRPYGVLVTGIGGAGVITLGALMAMAAHLEGKGCSTLDFTGLAQKNGAVMSHVRFAPHPSDLTTPRIGAGGADLVLGCDMVVAASPDALACIESGVSRAVVNSRVQPTAGFVLNPDLDLEQHKLVRALERAAGQGNVEFVDAARLATEILGDSIAANLFMLGFALQRGLVPLQAASLERAIELNGVAVEANKAALSWGRLAAHDLPAVEQAAGGAAPEPQPQSLQSLVDRRRQLLTAYQDAAYAAKYAGFVAHVAEIEAARTSGQSALTEAVARNLYKLMAYKDEYEVARLFTDGEFDARLRQQFQGDLRLQFHMAAPLFSRRDPATGHLRKRTYGPWLVHALRGLAALRGLRGTPLDPFGWTAERRLERQLVAEYQHQVRDLLENLSETNHDVAVRIASLPATIRGYGHVKMQNLERARAEERRLRAELDVRRLPAAAE